MRPDPVRHAPDDPEAERCLRDVRLLRQVLDHPVWQSYQKADKAAAVLSGEGGPQVFFGLAGAFLCDPLRIDPQVRIRRAVFCLQGFPELFHGLTDSIRGDRPGKNDLGAGIAGYCVVACPAVQADDPVFSTGFKPVEQAGQHKIRIRPPLADRHAGMTAAQAADREGQDPAFFLPAGSGQGADYLDAARAAGRDDALILRIQIDHPPALQVGQIYSVRPEKTDLLVDGKDAFKRRAAERIIGQKGQHDGDRDPVVAAQRGPVGMQPVTVLQDRDGFLFHVDRVGSFLLADHVNMSLQGDRRQVFTARAPRTADDQIAHLIPAVRQPVVQGKLLQIVADCLCVEGPVRDRRDLAKICKDLVCGRNVRRSRRGFSCRCLSRIRRSLRSGLLLFLFSGAVPAEPVRSILQDRGDISDITKFREIIVPSHFKMPFMFSNESLPRCWSDLWGCASWGRASWNMRHGDAADQLLSAFSKNRMVTASPGSRSHADTP